MDIRHFRIFLEVCETASMTQAARNLFMTQPSVSQAVAEMEKEYKVRLFERLNHHLYLTAAGEQLRSYASHILNLTMQAAKDLTSLGAGGSLRIGASLTTGAHLLPGLVNRYRQELPEVDIFTLVDNISVVEKMILEDRLDIALVESPVASSHLREEKLCDDDLILICGPGHPLWEQRSASVADLAGKAFIIREPGSGTRDIFERLMSQAGADWKVAGVYNNTEAIKQAVRGNLGLAVVPRISVDEEIQRGLLRWIEVESLDLKRQFNLVYHRQKFFTPAIQVFMRICKRQCSLSTV